MSDRDIPALEYRNPATTLTLDEGLKEYYASREGLVRDRGMSPEAREFFRCHDAAHVVFGCSTDLTEEAVVKIWSFFGTTAGFRLMRAYRLPESKEIYETLSFRDVMSTALHSIVIVPRTLRRCFRMTKRWPWSDFDRYLAMPLVEIRREFGIEVV